MVNKSRKAAFIAIGIMIAIVKGYEIATEPNFGFANSWSGEGMGFNLMHLALMFLAAWLIYKGLKKEK